jgi:uroporphyrinogen-III synthase
MLPLQGVGVLVTRPEQQSMPLCRLLESSGAIAVRLPAIDIKPAGNTIELSAEIGALEAFDLIVFTSANAVRFGAPLLRRKPNLSLAAIGPATARALILAGHRATVTPTDGYDSESLLRHPLLARMNGRRILIIKGMHGREMLQEQLTQRGAQVIAADVYERVRIHYSAAELAALEAKFAAGEIQVITATSAEIAASLLDLAPASLRREFDRVHWLVPGARVAGAVRKLGVIAPILRADTAEDQDLVAAIMRWRSSVSGA